MGALNKVFLLGNLGGDPEIRHTNNGAKVCNVNLCTNERRKMPDGTYEDHAEWHRLVAWNKTAEAMAAHLKKGSAVLIEGKLQTRTYEKEGQKHYATEIVVFNVQFIGGKADGGIAEKRQQADDWGAPAGVDDDIPF